MRILVNDDGFNWYLGFPLLFSFQFLHVFSLFFPVTFDIIKHNLMDITGLFHCMCRLNVELLSTSGETFVNSTLRKIFTEKNGDSIFILFI